MRDGRVYKGESWPGLLVGQGEGLQNEEIVAAVEGLPVALQALPTETVYPR